LEEAFQDRLELLTSARCRDVGEYNKDNPKPLPPLVVIVDEFADLADQLAGDKSAQRKFYMHLRRVAQLGRSRGIHLVLCTQRPSADLVPTNIRNLMNVRVSFCVNDAAASRMILDETGAEQLQMHGDLLFKEQAILTRAQGYFVSTDELDDLLESVQ
jgi:S-DNA-T family DNA segregation ATPase FtsK/SpoIIIE